MNDTSKQLVDAVNKALKGRETAVDFTGWAKVAVAAALRELADLMDDEDTDEGWPDAGDLELIADDIEAVS